MKKILLFILLISPAHAGNVYIDQIGNSNNITVTQSGAGSSEAILLSQGDGNQLGVSQTGDGNHQAFIGTPPAGMSGGHYIQSSSSGNDNNTLSILQSGSGNHTASINLDSTTYNSNNTASITQGGAADKSFTLNMSGSNIGATVVQDSNTTADSGSMNIQCFTTCTGITYTRH